MYVRKHKTAAELEEAWQLALWRSKQLSPFYYAPQNELSWDVYKFRSGHPCPVCNKPLARMLPLNNKIRIYHKSPRSDSLCRFMATFFGWHWVWQGK